MPGLFRCLWLFLFFLRHRFLAAYQFRQGSTVGMSVVRLECFLAILDWWMTYATVWQANISLCLMPSIPHWLDSNSFLKICTVAGCLIICRLQFRRLINLDTIQFSLIPSNELWASAQRKLSNSIDPINFCLIKPIALRTDELRWCRPAQQLFPSKH